MSSEDSDDDPRLEHVIMTALASTLSGVRTSLPAVVLAYDQASNRATIQLLVQESDEAESGQRVSKTIVIPDVPCAMIGWGSVRIKIPIKKGAQCWASFSSSALTAWKQSGRLSDPLDDRRHHDADVVVQPWMSVAVKDDDTLIEFTDSGEIHAAGSDRLALLDDLSRLKTAINGWTPVANDGGAALKTALSALFTTWPTGTDKLRGG